MYNISLATRQKPRISKLHYVQETQETLSKPTVEWVLATSIFCYFGRHCIRILVQTIDTL